MANINKIKTIGILTSGGDSPGMNNAIYAVLKTAKNFNMQTYLIMDGYAGLCAGKFKKIDAYDFLSYKDLGGTKIGSARYPEFKELNIRKSAVAKLKSQGIQALIVIGGDGSYMGAKKLSDMGINCIALPGTIDNNIQSTVFTIGFDSTLNYIVEAVNSIRSTCESHNRCMIVEVMGQYCGDLALFSGIATNVDLIVTPETKLTENEIIANAKKAKDNNNRSYVILVTENIYPSVENIAKKIENEVGYVSRAIVLGQVQRGLQPSFIDLFITSLMGSKAVELLSKGKKGRCIGFYFNKVVDYDINKALKLKPPSHKDLYNYFNYLSKKRS